MHTFLNHFIIFIYPRRRRRRRRRGRADISAMNGSSSQMTCVLRLDTQTSGWDRSMHKLFKGIRDVTYTIDATRGLAYVSGKISPEIILRIRKARKHAQLIHMDYGYANPFYPPDSNPTAPPYPEIPPDNVPIHFNYYPELSPQPPPHPPPPPSPPHHMCYYYHPCNYAVAVPYYYHPYYGVEMPYSPPPQLPTRDAVTGEQQCRIL